jgi:hypothetical protein
MYLSKHHPYYHQMVYDTISLKASIFSSEGGGNVEGGGQLEVLNEIKGIYLCLYAIYIYIYIYIFIYSYLYAILCA